MKAFWEKAGTADPNNSKTFNPAPDNIVSKITFVNWANDRYYTSINGLLNHEAQTYYSYSFVDAIACAIANICAFASLIGRVKKL